MKNIKFLWRESYVDYLWATETTGKSYYFDSGYLVYRDGVLSAYATKNEIKVVRTITKSLSDEPSTILKISKEFGKVKENINKFHIKIKKTSLSKINTENLFKLFEEVINLYNIFIRTYRFTEPHMLEHIENKALGVVSSKFGKDSNRVLAELISSPQNAKNYFQEENINLFNLIQRISKIRFEAKKITNDLLTDTEKILIETSKRTKYAVNQISSMSIDELKSILVNNREVDTRELNNRVRLFGLRIKVVNGEVEIKRLKYNQIKLIEKSQDDFCKEIKGDVVYPGKVLGKVRLVKKLFSKKDYGKFMETIQGGDIIVAPMISPNLTPCFSRVSGIVTDEGGLMSHAALISRERKIPCIVGTKNATNRLKENDVIELDADKGIVTIKLK